METEPKYDRDVFYQTLEYLRDYQDRVEGHNDLEAILTIFDDMQSTINDLLQACKLAMKLADAVVEQVSGNNIEVLMFRATINEAIVKAESTES